MQFRKRLLTTDFKFDIHDNLQEQQIGIEKENKLQ